MTPINSFPIEELYFNTSAFIAILDENWVLLEVNKAWPKALGYPEFKIVGSPLAKFLILTDSLDEIRKEVDACENTNGLTLQFLNHECQPYWVKFNICKADGLLYFFGLPATEDVLMAKMMQNIGELHQAGGFIYDVNTGNFQSTPLIKKILELPQDAILNQNVIISHIHPEFRATYEEAVRKLYQVHQGYDLKIKLITAKANEKWVHSISQCEVINNKISVIYGSLRDITQLEESKRENTRIKQNMEMALKAMNSGYFVLDLKTNVLECSPSFGEMIGIENMLTFEDFQKRMHPKDQQVVATEHINQLIRPGNHYYHFYRLKNTDKGYRYYEIHGWKILDKFGKPVQLVGNFIDVHEKVKQQESRKLYQRQMESIINTGNVHSVYLDKDFRVIIADKATRRMILEEYGLDPVKTKVNYSQIIPEHQRVEFVADMAKVRSENIIKKEVRHVNFNGVVNWYDVTYTKATDNGEFSGYVLTYLNITNTKIAMLNLKHAQKYLTELDRAKDEILSNLNHELRTPLNGLLSASALLAEVREPEAVQKLLQVQQKSSDRLLQTFNNLINFSTLTARREALEFCTVNLKVVVVNAYEHHKQQAELKGLAFRLILDCEEEIWVHADEMMLEQSISNIVHNAVKFTHDGTIIITLTRSSNNYACIKIKDSGVGIAANKLERIFDSFEQESQGSTRLFEGSGLGLSFSHKFVNLLEGEVTVESKKYVGSIFKIKIPILNEDTLS
ncbi:MAG: PAS domain-containing sensor histidine kinase [Leeuwenhoekiella sp.]